MKTKTATINPLIEKRTTDSKFFSICVFILLAGIYLFPEKIKIISIVYIILMLLFVLTHTKTMKINYAPLVPWIFFVIIGLLTTMLCGVSAITDAVEFIISIAIGMIVQSIYVKNDSKKGVLIAVFAVSVIAFLGCCLQLFAPSLLLKFNSFSLGAEKYETFMTFYSYNYLAGFSYQTGVTGHYLAIFIGFLLCYGLFEKNMTKMVRIISIGLAIVGYLLLFLTGKRGELLIVALLGFMLVCYRFRKHFLKILGIGAVMAIAGVCLLVFTEEGRFLLERTFGDSPLSGRDVIYSQLIEVFEKNILLGAGFSSVLKFIEGFTNGHNIYLQLLAENGIVGFVTLMAIFLFNVILTVKVIIRKTTKTDDVTLAIMSLFIQLHFLLAGLIGNPLYDVYPLIVYMLSVGVAHYLNLKKGNNNENR